MKAIVIEKRTVERAYGLNGIEAIVDHPVYGRLLVCDGFGGSDSLRGGAVRFEHGAVYKLRGEDTFDTLMQKWNDTETIFSAVIHGYDESRPLLEWNGWQVANLAEGYGL